MRVIHCCLCGAQFGRFTWRQSGVIAAQVNSGKRHYFCKMCRDADPAGMTVWNHASDWLDGLVGCKRGNGTEEWKTQKVTA